jgi:hypothetical protein
MKIIPIFLILFITGCSTSPPSNTENLCAIFKEKDDWYEASKEAEQQWNVPIAVQMAIMHQESRFVADAQPPRPRLLGFIPWFRNSSAYGYPQAQDGTWEDYLENGGKWSADRDDFADSTDFIGWYCAISHQKLGIAKWDARNLYLAYHEGHHGFKRQTHRNKTWLIKTAQKVDHKAKRYQAQLKTCEQELGSSGWFFW